MPDLRRGDVAVELVRAFEHRQEPGGEHVSVLRQAPQPAAARTDRGKLSRHVQRRQQDQEDDDHRRQEHVAGMIQESGVGSRESRVGRESRLTALSAMTGSTCVARSPAGC